MILFRSLRGRKIICSRAKSKAIEKKIVRNFDKGQSILSTTVSSLARALFIRSWQSWQELWPCRCLPRLIMVASPFHVKLSRSDPLPYTPSSFAVTMSTIVIFLLLAAVSFLFSACSFNKNLILEY